MIGCVDSKYDLLDHMVTVYIPGNKTFWLFDCNRIEEQGDKSKGKSKLIPLIRGTTMTGYEPTLPEGNGLAVHCLNHLATLSSVVVVRANSFNSFI